jgi:hypothetical protein
MRLNAHIICHDFVYRYTSIEESEETRLGWRNVIKTDLKNGESDCGLDSYY